MIPTINLIRERTSDQGTEGVLYFEGHTCYTLELPWKQNLLNLSCIPAREYKLIWCYSHKYRRGMYLISGVFSRTGIRIHSGNVAGDREKGFRTHSLGCPVLGKYRGVLYGQRAVLYSRPTVRLFERVMNKQEGKIIIKNAWFNKEGKKCLE